MRKIFYLIIILLFLSYKTYSQEFELKNPNIEKLRGQVKTDFKNEGIYYYLINNYNPISELYEKEFYEWEKESICSFKRDFENNIKYSIFQCKEAGGILVNVEFPKISREKLMRWIEQMYEIDKMDIDVNVWKENNSKFEPSEINPGCYYKISEKENRTIVDLYCGC